MPSQAETHMPGYSWWDLYNVSTFFHALGHDVFILSMPLKGANFGLGYDTAGKLVKNETGGGQVDHWWFLQWETKGDAALRCGMRSGALILRSLCVGERGRFHDHRRDTHTRARHACVSSLPGTSLSLRI